MEEKEKNVITLVDGKTGEEREADVLLMFKLEENGPDYLIYTFNEEDDKGLVKVYTSMFKKTEEGVSLENIQTEEEWTKIKEVMRKAINDNRE